MRRRDWAGTVLDLLDHRWLNRAGNASFLGGLVWSIWKFIGGNPVNALAIVLMVVGIALMSAQRVRALRERKHKRMTTTSMESTQQLSIEANESKPRKFDAEMHTLFSHGRQNVGDSYLIRTGSPIRDSAERNEHLRWKSEVIWGLEQRDHEVAKRFMDAANLQEQLAVLAEFLGIEEE
jgi:hypothetical protein